MSTDVYSCLHLAVYSCLPVKAVSDGLWLLTTNFFSFLCEMCIFCPLQPVWAMSTYCVSSDEEEQRPVGSDRGTDPMSCSILVQLGGIVKRAHFKINTALIEVKIAWHT